MNTTPTIACDLQSLDADERQREQALLGFFRSLATGMRWTGTEHHLSLPADAVTLSQLGEFLALERRCCPFLRFTLLVDSSAMATLSIAGPEGSREFVAATFGAPGST